MSPIKVDFSMNDVLITYLNEQNFRFDDPNDHLRITTFCTAIKVLKTTLKKMYLRKDKIGPIVQARIYFHTGDERFAPRDKCERKACNKIKKNTNNSSHKRKKPTKIKPNTLAITKDKDPYFLNKALCSLIEKFQIGKKGKMTRKDLRIFLQLKATTFQDLVGIRTRFSATNKVKIWLGTNDPSFKPLTANEKALEKELLKLVPKPLPFAVSDETFSPPKPKSKEPSEKKTSNSFDALVKDKKFIKAIVEEVIIALGENQENKHPSGLTAQLKTSINTTLSLIDQFIQLDTDEREQVQSKLQSDFEDLETALFDLLLKTRAANRTASAEAAKKIYESEKEFTNEFKESINKTNEEN